MKNEKKVIKIAACGLSVVWEWREGVGMLEGGKKN
jgi:hypothetical protein